MLFRRIKSVWASSCVCKLCYAHRARRLMHGHSTVDVHASTCRSLPYGDVKVFATACTQPECLSIFASVLRSPSLAVLQRHASPKGLVVPILYAFQSIMPLLHQGCVTLYVLRATAIGCRYRA